MTTLDKLHAIEEKKTIYDIHYCNAGIGFIFYYPVEGDTLEGKPPANWKEGLSVHKYYPTFEEAVDAEYARL